MDDCWNRLPNKLFLRACGGVGAAVSHFWVISIPRYVHTRLGAQDLQYLQVGRRADTATDDSYGTSFVSGRGFSCGNYGAARVALKRWWP